MLKNELKKKVIEKSNRKKDITDTDKEDDYIVLNKVSENYKKADVYSLIKYASRNLKDIVKIQSTINVLLVGRKGYYRETCRQ